MEDFINSLTKEELKELKILLRRRAYDRSEMNRKIGKYVLYPIEFAEDGTLRIMNSKGIKKYEIGNSRETARYIYKLYKSKTKDIISTQDLLDEEVKKNKITKTFSLSLKLNPVLTESGVSEVRDCTINEIIKRYSGLVTKKDILEKYGNDFIGIYAYNFLPEYLYYFGATEFNSESFFDNFDDMKSNLIRVGYVNSLVFTVGKKYKAYPINKFVYVDDFFEELLKLGFEPRFFQPNFESYLDKLFPNGYNNEFCIVDSKAKKYRSGGMHL